MSLRRLLVACLVLFHGGGLRAIRTRGARALPDHVSTGFSRTPALPRERAGARALAILAQVTSEIGGGARPGTMADLWQSYAWALLHGLALLMLDGTVLA